MVVAGLPSQVAPDNVARTHSAGGSRLMAVVVAFGLLGIGSGGLISGIGLGVVLSYRGAGVINLAAGAIAMLAGFFFWAIRLGQFAMLSTAPAVILTLLFAATAGVAFELLVVRPQRTSTPLAKLLATLGALLACQAGVVLVFGPAARPQPTVLPTQNVIVGGAPVPVYNFVIGVILLAITLGLIAAYRRTTFGAATRAAAENEAHAMLMGLSPGWLSLVNTVLMSVLMGVVGLLAASVIEVDSTTLPLLVVPGLAAAIFGRFTSFGTTFIAGMLIGVGESLLLYASTQSWFPNQGMPGIPIPGGQELLSFLILVVAMFVRGGKITARGEVLERRLPRAPMPRHPVRSTLTYGGIAAVALPLLPAAFRSALTSSLIWAVLLLSLVIITGYLGQVSVVQLALGGAAGFAVSDFATNFGIGFPWAPIMGVLGATLLGFLCGIPALRIRGVSLAVVTLAAAVAIEAFWFGNASFGGGSGVTVPAPALFGFGFGPNASLSGLDGAVPSPLFGWFVLVVLCAVALGVCNLRRSALGQDMLAVRANERAAAAAGVNVAMTKLLGFALSAGVAGVGGVLLAYQSGFITPTTYDTFTSLALIAFGYIAGITTVAGAVFGGLIFTTGLAAFALQYWFGLQGQWFSLAAALLLIVMLSSPQGIATAVCYGDRSRARSLRGAPATPTALAGSHPRAGG
jgi:branched-chain amino acid transport system permease protein